MACEQSRRFSAFYGPLCTSSGNHGYKKAHVNHPMTKWVRESRGNYRFAVRLAAAYRNYYNGGKVAIAQWKTRDPPPWWGGPITNNIPFLPPS